MAQAKAQEASRQRLSSKFEEVTIRGFKSLKEVKEFPLTDVNILVGANGSGKSNFIGFFEMLSWISKSGKLQDFIAAKGGADDLLFGGAKTTRAIECNLKLKTEAGRNEYGFNLQYTEANALAFGREEYRFTSVEKLQQGAEEHGWTPLGSGHAETRLPQKRNEEKRTAGVILKILQNCSTYQFHDTSTGGPLKLPAFADDHIFLKSNGTNLAAILYDLRESEPATYRDILLAARAALPGLDDFELQLHPKNGKIYLNWTQKGGRKVFSPHLTSDGTLRWFALATLLCMPPERLANIILLDEPELGLHPHAISVLASLIKHVGGLGKQVVVATQSPLLVNEFAPEDIIVAELAEDYSTILSRPNKADLENWLTAYNCGDLWQQGVFGGNPK